MGGLIKIGDAILKKGVFEGDANTLKTAGVYYVNNTTQNVDNSVGLLFVLCVESSVVHVLFNVFDGTFRARGLLYNNGGWDKWSVWKKVSFV